MEYKVLTKSRKAAIIRDRLQELEGDHFRLTKLQVGADPGTPELHKDRIDQLERHIGELQAELAAAEEKEKK